ncbi:flavin-containing monooxygenase/FMO family protein [Ceratobasidium sp. AG-Ba]|nr:flavin-containing monooxygenase/FMO family protein [Ceratobasidium sp. AG-Ba]
MLDLKPDPFPRSFAVVGAGGAAGLAAMKIILEELKDHFRARECELVGFEQREDVGGIWLTDPSPALDNEYPYSPIYDFLTTNVPHPIMYYPSHPAPPAAPLFSNARVVKDYMQDYALQFDLIKRIKFHTRVTSAVWDSSANQWEIAYQENGPPRSSYFDRLFVTNGHYRYPYIPEFTGLDKWLSSNSRSHIHSVWYRNSESYREKRVLIVGGGRSAVDISEEVSAVAKRTVRSIHSLGSEQDLDPWVERGAISHFSSDGFVHFKSGTKEYIERVIFATGYKYDFTILPQIPAAEPRLSSDHLYSSGFHLYPLALHIFPLKAAFPPSSVAFIGLPIGIPGFFLVEAQATLAVRQMMGKVSLDFDHELSEAHKRNDALIKEHKGSALRVAQKWHRFRPDTPQPYDLADLIWERAQDSRRVPSWQRELMPEGLVLRAEWQKLERLGLSKAWLEGMGRGDTQDWIDLMRRLLKRAHNRRLGAPEIKSRL